MTKQKQQSASQASQPDKFRELARELEADESPQRFDERLRKIVKSPPLKDSDKEKGK